MLRTGNFEQRETLPRDNDFNTPKEDLPSWALVLEAAAVGTILRRSKGVSRDGEVEAEVRSDVGSYEKDTTSARNAWEQAHT